MELRRHALKLRFWPQVHPVDQSGQVLDVDWESIKSCQGKNIYELRVDDEIGGQRNIRVIFFVAQKRPEDARPIIWLLAALPKKRDEWTKANLITFEARRKLVLERFYEQG
jgi:hypothetical protein